MGILTLDVEVAPSSTFHKAVTAAKDLAARLDLAYVRFDFNGVEVYADGSYTQYTEAELNGILQDAYKTKFVCV